MRKQLGFFCEKYASIFLAIILIIGIYTRFRLVFDKSFPFTYDIGRDLLALHNLVSYLDIPLIGPTTGLPGLFYGPWWYYVLVPAYIAGGGNPQVVNAFMGVTGLAVVVLGYIIGKKAGNIFFGLLFAALLSFAPSLVAASTQIWNPNVAPLYLILIFYFLLKIITSRKKSDWRYKSSVVLLGIFAGLNIDSEVVYGLILTFGLAWYFIFFLFKKEFKNYFYFISGLLVIFLPRILFEFRHDFIMTRTIFTTNIQGGHVDLFTSIPNEFVKALLAILQLWNLTVGVTNNILGICIGVSTLALVVIGYKNFSVPIKSLLHYSLLSIGMYVVLLTFFHGDIWGHYLVGVPIFFLFVLTAALSVLFRMKRLWYVAVAVLFSIFFLQISPVAIYSYYTSSQPVGNASLYRNQLEVIDYVYKEAKGRQFNEIVYTPPVHDYTYQYLFLWYADKKYHYQPSGAHQPLFFVIYEPDPGYEGRLKNWLDERQHDGRVTNEKRLPSGITIQTRIH